MIADHPQCSECRAPAVCYGPRPEGTDEFRCADCCDHEQICAGLGDIPMLQEMTQDILRDRSVLTARVMALEEHLRLLGEDPHTPPRVH